jgi:predicted lipoprotein with Yx(FWY)xxD motif
VIVSWRFLNPADEEDQEGDSECEEHVENAVEAQLATEEASSEGRFKVHNDDGQKQYRHLENHEYALRESCD